MISMCIIFLGYQLLQEDPHEFLKREANAKKEIEISVPRNLKIPKGETAKIILSDFWVGWSRLSDTTIEDILEDINSGNEDFFWQEEAYANEDGSITLVLTQEQLERNIDRVEENLERIAKDNYGRMEIIISEDFQSVTYYIKEGCTILQWHIAYVGIVSYMFKAQTLSGILPQGGDIRTIIIAEKAGEVIIDKRAGYEDFEITHEEWNQKVGVEVAN